MPYNIFLMGASYGSLLATSRRRKERESRTGPPWRHRSNISRNRDQVVISQLGDYGFHQARPFALAKPSLHVIELPPEVAGGPTRETGYGTETSQILSVTEAACGGPTSAGLHQSFASF